MKIAFVMIFTLFLVFCEKQKKPIEELNKNINDQTYVHNDTFPPLTFLPSQKPYLELPDTILPKITSGKALLLVSISPDGKIIHHTLKSLRLYNNEDNLLFEFNYKYNELDGLNKSEYGIIVSMIGSIVKKISMKKNKDAEILKENLVIILIEITRSLK